MKHLGLDLGTKSLGIAISDSLGMLARGYENLRFESEQYKIALDRVVEVVKKEKIDKIVLGLPKNMDGSVGFQGNVCLRFKEMINEILPNEVIFIDERLSSKQASSMMIEQNLKKKKRKSSIDMMAAVIILQTYLDRS